MSVLSIAFDTFSGRKYIRIGSSIFDGTGLEWNPINSYTTNLMVKVKPGTYSKPPMLD